MLTGPAQSDNLFSSSVVISCQTDVVTKNPALICLTNSNLKHSVTSTWDNPITYYQHLLIKQEINTTWPGLQNDIAINSSFSSANGNRYQKGTQAKFWALPQTILGTAPNSDQLFTIPKQTPLPNFRKK